jgi:hypothetical protein
MKLVQLARAGQWGERAGGEALEQNGKTPKKFVAFQKANTPLRLLH